jgi:hypothetical protein
MRRRGATPDHLKNKDFTAEDQQILAHIEPIITSEYAYMRENLMTSPLGVAENPVTQTIARLTHGNVSRGPEKATYALVARSLVDAYKEGGDAGVIQSFAEMIDSRNKSIISNIKPADLITVQTAAERIRTAQAEGSKTATTEPSETGLMDRFAPTTAHKTGWIMWEPEVKRSFARMVGTEDARPTLEQFIAIARNGKPFVGAGIPDNYVETRLAAKALSAASAAETLTPGGTG